MLARVGRAELQCRRCSLRWIDELRALQQWFRCFNRAPLASQSPAPTAARAAAFAVLASRRRMVPKHRRPSALHEERTAAPSHRRALHWDGALNAAMLRQCLTRTHPLTLSPSTPPLTQPLPIPLLAPRVTSVVRTTALCGIGGVSADFDALLHAVSPGALLAGQCRAVLDRVAAINAQHGRAPATPLPVEPSATQTAPHRARALQDFQRLLEQPDTADADVSISGTDIEARVRDRLEQTEANDEEYEYSLVDHARLAPLPSSNSSVDMGSSGGDDTNLVQLDHALYSLVSMVTRFASKTRRPLDFAELRAVVEALTRASCHPPLAHFFDLFLPQLPASLALIALSAFARLGDLKRATLAFTHARQRYEANGNTLQPRAYAALMRVAANYGLTELTQTLFDECRAALNNHHYPSIEEGGVVDAASGDLGVSPSLLAVYLIASYAAADNVPAVNRMVDALDVESLPLLHALEPHVLHDYLTAIFACWARHGDKHRIAEQWQRHAPWMHDKTALAITILVHSLAAMAHGDPLQQERLHAHLTWLLATTGLPSALAGELAWRALAQLCERAQGELGVMQSPDGNREHSATDQSVSAALPALAFEPAPLEQRREFRRWHGLLAPLYAACLARSDGEWSVRSSVPVSTMAHGFHALLSLYAQSARCLARREFDALFTCLDEAQRRGVELTNATWANLFAAPDRAIATACLEAAAQNKLRIDATVLSGLMRALVGRQRTEWVHELLDHAGPKLEPHPRMFASLLALAARAPIVDEDARLRFLHSLVASMQRQQLFFAESDVVAVVRALRRASSVPLTHEFYSRVRVDPLYHTLPIARAFLRSAQQFAQAEFASQILRDWGAARCCEDDDTSCLALLALAHCSFAPAVPFARLVLDKPGLAPVRLAALVVALAETRGSDALRQRAKELHAKSVVGQRHWLSEAAELMDLADAEHATHDWTESAHVYSPRAHSAESPSAPWRSKR